MHTLYYAVAGILLLAVTAWGDGFDALTIDRCSPVSPLGNTTGLNQTKCANSGNAPDWSGDTRFIGIYNFERPTIAGGKVFLDASPGTNPVNASIGGYPAVVQTAHQGCWGFPAALNTWRCSSADGCTETDFFFTSGNFTVGAWVFPQEVPPGGPTNGIAPVLDTAGNGAGVATGWDFGVDSGPGATQNFAFQINGTATLKAESATAYSLDTWAHAVARYTDATDTGEFIINGLLDANTLSSPQPIGGGGFFLNNGINFGRLVGTVDEEFVFAGAMATTDLCRIAVCGIDGCACTCDTGTPANYATRPRHTSAGGPLTCTMPACDKTGPT